MAGTNDHTSPDRGAVAGRLVGVQVVVAGVTLHGLFHAAESICEALISVLCVHVLLTLAYAFAPESQNAWTCVRGTNLAWVYL